MAVKAVIFDIGNVLIEWQPERYYDATIGPERRADMFAKVDLHAMNDRVDMGHPFKETIYGTAEEYPEFRDEIRDWHDNWIKLAQPAIPKSVEILRRLRAQGMPVFCLTNFGIESFAYAKTQYDFLGEFDQEFVSGHMAVTKPDAKIYQMVEETCGVAPENLLFTDDRQDNIDMAARRGWGTHLFTSPEGWEQSLRDHGVLSS